MRKRFFRLFLLSLIISVITMVSVQLVQYVDSSQIIQRMDSGAIGDYSAVLSVKSDSFDEKLLFELAKKTGKRIGIYADFDNGEGGDTVFKKVYYTGSLIPMPMIRGRFFIDSDFENGDSVVVVGKNVKGLINRNGKEFLNIQNKEYMVIGVLGTKDSTVWDNYVLVNFRAGLQNEPSKLYTIDVFSKRSSKIPEMLAESLKSEYGIDAQVLVGTKGFVSGFLPMLATAKWFILAILGHSFAFFLLSTDWAIRRKRETGILMLLGFSEKQIMMISLGTFMIAPLFSILIIVPICLIFFPLYLSFAFLILGLCMLVGLCTISITIAGYLAQMISEVIA